MRLEQSQEYEARVRAVRKRLALDFRPLKDTLAKGLDVLIDPEAAVYCTATVEALCDALFCTVIKNLHDEAAAGVTPLETKITVSHIQVALRSHSDIASVLARVDGAALVLEFFLDDATSRALYTRRLIATPAAKHLRTSAVAGTNDDELIAMHARTRAEWQRREDDPFSDVDFATVLKCAHPAFTLSYNATALLSALVRELLNGVCDLVDVEAAQRRVPPELYLNDVEAPLARVFHVGETGEQVARTARDCLERFRLRSRKGSTLTLRFRLLTSVHATLAQTPHALGTVARDTPFARLLPQMCKKCHADASATVAVYRGHAVELQSTPATLSMPTGAVVFLVARKWWDHTRRNEARRGLLSSLRPQDAQLKSLVASAKSKVQKSCQPTVLASSQSASSTALRRDESLETQHMQPQLARSNNAVAAGSISSTASLHGAVASPSRSAVKVAGASPMYSAAPVRRMLRDRQASENEDPSECAEDDDSLSLLLKQRPKPAAAHRHVSSSRLTLDNNMNDDALTEMQQRLALGRGAHASPQQHSRSSASLGSATRRSLAARNAQLMATLDDAWLGFAAISGGARSLGERMGKWRDGAELQHQQQEHADEPSGSALPGGGDNDAVPSQSELAELEVELLARLERTEELAAQTAAAKQLMAQLVEQVQLERQRW